MKNPGFIFLMIPGFSQFNTEFQDRVPRSSMPYRSSFLPFFAQPRIKLFNGNRYGNGHELWVKQVPGAQLGVRISGLDLGSNF